MPKNKKTTKPSAVIKGPPSKKKKRVLFLRNTRSMFFSKVFIAFFLSSVFAGGVSYYLFISQAFAIQHVSFEGFSPSVEERVAASFSEKQQDKIFLFLSRNNTLTFPEKEFTQEVLLSVPRVRNISITTSLPDSITVSGEERKQEGIWCDIKDRAHQKCFFYDKEGVIYEEAPGSARGSLLTIIRDARYDNYELPHNVLDEEIRNYIEELISILENVNKKPLYVTAQRHNEIRVGFAEGWEAYFAFPGDTAEQVENLNLILNEEVGPRTSELEYIDLRLGNKAFYRFRE